MCLHKIVLTGKCRHGVNLNNCSKCFSTPGKVPCCIKDGKPGKIDPKTKECEEECDCDPNDPKAPKGVKVYLCMRTFLSTNSQVTNPLRLHKQIREL